MTDNKKKTHLIVTGRGGGSGEQVQADWNQTNSEQPDYIKNKPELATVATTGDYDDLTNKPTIPTQWFGTQQEYDAISVKDPNTIYNIEGSDNVQADWNQTDSTALDYIKNKPSIPSGQVQADWNQTDNAQVDYIKNKPTIPAAQVNADWNAVSGVAEILNKPTIPVVPAMTTETLTFTLQDSTTKTITFFTAITGYFYVEDASGSDNTLSIVKNNENAPTVEVFASTDQMSWTSMGSTSTTAITATIPANGKLYLKATANVWGGDNYNNIAASGAHNVGGNIMSLIYGDNFSNQTEFPAGSNSNFANVFKNSTNIVSAANLILPATTLPTFAYLSMFGNSSLTIAPAIPAATIGFYSCTGMFSGCRALTTAPVISASIIGEVGCSGMFQNCTSLTTAPALPATTLNGSWCYSHIFEGCTSLTTAPELPATTIGEGCYAWMFKGCPNIDRVVSYAQTIGRNALSEWLDGASQTGDFYNLGGATYESGVSGIPTGWTEHTSL